MFRETVIERLEVDWLPDKYQLFVNQADVVGLDYYLKLSNGFVVANFWENSNDCSWQVWLGAASLESYDRNGDVKAITEWCINQFESEA